MRIFLTAILSIVAATSMAQDTCCKAEKKLSAEAEFMKIAQEMESKASGAKKAKAMDCCQSTEKKPIAKAEDGCCNASGEPAKFKVFVAGTGYKFFGCAESANQSRKDLLAKGVRVGTIQKVSKKTSI
jgi:hypothetical protein